MWPVGLTGKSVAQRPPKRAHGQDAEAEKDPRLAGKVSRSDIGQHGQRAEDAKTAGARGKSEGGFAVGARVPGV